MNVLAGQLDWTGQYADQEFSPEADYRELGPGYYDQRATRRQAHSHIHSLERLGYEVTMEPIDPETGALTAKAS